MDLGTRHTEATESSLQDAGRPQTGQPCPLCEENNFNLSLTDYLL